MFNAGGDQIGFLLQRNWFGFRIETGLGGGYSRGLGAMELTTHLEWPGLGD